MALAWEGDAYKECFPGIDSLWLEEGFQEENFKQRHGDNFPKFYAQSLLERLRNASQPTMSEWMANADPPPEPRSKKELVDRVSEHTRSETFSVPEGFDRDARWETAICERISGLRDGWIAVVVGWTHADPAGDTNRLRSLLSSRGFCVNSVRVRP